MKPNVVLITVDQMRGDCTGALGHHTIETPNLDMMVKEGYTFTNAFSATPTCIAARAALLTGLTQRTHGRTGYRDGVGWKYPHTIAGEFTAAGYHTQCIGKMHVFPTRNLLGFHNVVLHDGYLHNGRSSRVASEEHWNNTDDYLQWLREKIGSKADILDSGLECNSWTARPWPYEEQYHPTNWVVDQSIDFLRRRDPSKPFFLMQSFVRPHSPLDPPQAYYDMYINEDIPMPKVGDWVDIDTERNGLYPNCYSGEINKKALKRAMASYYALITHIDAQIGRFIQILSEYGQLSNTIILFTSDHGDLMGDHNFFRKALPYQGSVSVPFIVYDPGNHLKGKKGSIIDKLIELRDIMPTLLDAANIEIPESIEGCSVLPLLDKSDTQWREYIHGEHSLEGENLGIKNHSHHFIVTDKDKYIWFSHDGREQYFDLENDPHELHNLAGDDKCSERISYLRSKLVKELEGREEGYSDGTKLITGRKPQTCLNHIL